MQQEKKRKKILNYEKEKENRYYCYPDYYLVSHK